MYNFQYVGLDWVEHAPVYHAAKNGRPSNALTYRDKEKTPILTDAGEYVTRENSSLYVKLYFPDRKKTYLLEIGECIRELFRSNSEWKQKITGKFRNELNKQLSRLPVYEGEDSSPRGYMRIRSIKYIIWKTIYLYNMQVVLFTNKECEDIEKGKTKIEFFIGTSQEAVRIVDGKILKKDLTLEKMEDLLGKEFLEKRFPYQDDVISQKMISK